MAIVKYGAICDPGQLKENFKMNCIPEGMEARELEHDDHFLKERRKLIAKRIRNYYKSL